MNLLRNFLFSWLIRSCYFSLQSAGVGDCWAVRGDYLKTFAVKFGRSLLRRFEACGGVFIAKMDHFLSQNETLNDFLIGIFRFLDVIMIT